MLFEARVARCPLNSDLGRAQKSLGTAYLGREELLRLVTNVFHPPVFSCVFLAPFWLLCCTTFDIFPFCFESVGFAHAICINRPYRHILRKSCLPQTKAIISGALLLFTAHRQHFEKGTRPVTSHHRG